MACSAAMFLAICLDGPVPAKTSRARVRVHKSVLHLVGLSDHLVEDAEGCLGDDHLSKPEVGALLLDRVGDRTLLDDSGKLLGKVAPVLGVLLSGLLGPGADGGHCLAFTHDDVSLFLCH